MLIDVGLLERLFCSKQQT